MNTQGKIINYIVSLIMVFAMVLGLCASFEMTVKMEDEQKIDRIRFKISEEELENKNMEDENA